MEQHSFLRPTMRGFSLIEIMIVIGIIALLAGIAVPAYNNYVTKSKVAGALIVVDKTKTDLVDFYAESGRLPGATDTFLTATHDAFTSVSFGLVNQIDWTNDGGAACAGFTYFWIFFRFDVNQTNMTYTSGFGGPGIHLLAKTATTGGNGVITYLCGPWDATFADVTKLPSSCNTFIGAAYAACK